MNSVGPVSLVHLGTAAVGAWVLKLFDPLPVIGHLWHYGLRDRHSQAEWSLNALKHFDHKTWMLRIPGIIPRGHMVSDPAVLKYITLNKHQMFNKQGYFADCTRELLGQGIVVAVDDTWTKQRNAAHAFLNPDMLAQLTAEVLPRHLDILFDKMDEAAQGDSPIDLSSVLVRYIFAVFGDIAWDTKWEDIQDLSEVFDQVADGISYRFALPAFRFWERILPYGARLRKNFGIIRNSVSKLLQGTREKVQAEELGERDPDPDPGLLIRSLLREDMSEEMTIDALVNFANAGRSTTTHAIAWTVYELLRYPDHLAALVAALDAHAEVPTGKLIRELPLLSNIISQSLRLNPSVPIEAVLPEGAIRGTIGGDEDEAAEQRWTVATDGHSSVEAAFDLLAQTYQAAQSQAPSPVALPDGTVILPGDIIYWCIWAINRSPRSFGPDSEQFRPERWEAMEKKPSTDEFATFYSGPRTCPGQQMARLEIAFVLAELFKRYELSPAWDSPRRLDEGIGGEMQGGLPVKVTRRVARVAGVVQGGSQRGVEYSPPKGLFDVFDLLVWAHQAARDRLHQPILQCADL